jgi:hypothetical protein
MSTRSGSRRQLRFIYGPPRLKSVASPSGVCINPCANIRDTFIAFSDLIYKVERTIPFNYTVEGAISEFVADMKARAYVSPALFVRLVWRHENPDVKFEIDNRIHRLQIKDIYARYKYNYLADRLFQDAIGQTLVD